MMFHNISYAKWFFAWFHMIISMRSKRDLKVQITVKIVDVVLLPRFRRCRPFSRVIIFEKIWGAEDLRIRIAKDLWSEIWDLWSEIRDMIWDMWSEIWDLRSEIRIFWEIVILEPSLWSKISLILLQGVRMQTVTSNLDQTEIKNAINFNLKVDSDQGSLGISFYKTPN